MANLVLSSVWFRGAHFEPPSLMRWKVLQPAKMSLEALMLHGKTSQWCPGKSVFRCRMMLTAALFFAAARF
jgi:hypothetical protein